MRLLGRVGNGPFLSQILAGSPLEPDFGNLGASGSRWGAPGKPLANSPFGIFGGICLYGI